MDSEKINNEALQQEDTAEAVESTKPSDAEISDEAAAEDAAAEDTAQEIGESLEEKLAQAEQTAKDNYDKFLRKAAEFENFRKRTNAEKAGMYSNGVRDTVEKLLPVIDNFERAVDMSQEKESSLYKGVEMILKQLLEITASLGVEEIPALGEPFDPNVHSAVMHIEDEKCDENVVVEVFQKGYRLGDRVIRPSMVKVAN
ncbi:MAG: nucleotide exchange factor GrpE [Lachnospiraceae bacterium]|nr:nucleotide exchange factor GrpE [Lachnospiraceae bacterium]MBR6401513.1 nucleotide exchange factor GrpE [Bacillota bacterium]